MGNNDWLAHHKKDELDRWAEEAHKRHISYGELQTETYIYKERIRKEKEKNVRNCQYSVDKIGNEC